MNIFEIKEYMDGGPNDRGFIVGYTVAGDAKEAKMNYAISINDVSIMQGGNIQTSMISKSTYHNRCVEAQKQLELLKMI